jgi:hypothetical protein
MGIAATPEGTFLRAAGIATRSDLHQLNFRHPAERSRT